MSRERAAWVICLVAFALTAAGMILLGLVPAEQAPAGERLIDVIGYLPMTVTFASVGALLASRRPRNPIGWLLLSVGAVSGLQYLAAGYGVFGLFGPSRLPGAQIAAWVSSWSGSTVTVPMSAAVFTFPDGRFTLYRARIGFGFAAIGAALTAIAAALVPGTLFNVVGVENPFGLAGQEALITVLFLIAGVLVFGTMGLMISTVYERYRTASYRERLQFRWFASGVACAALLVGVAGGLVLVNWTWAKIGATSALSLIPAALAVAILRQHLYDIEVVINRALVYGATTGLIAIAFFGGIVVLQTALRPFTSGSELAVAISTLLSFALFQPLRARVRTAVDRRFYRARYDAIQTLDQFSVRLRDQVALDAVRDDLLNAARETMQPTHASLWLRQP